MDFRPYDPDVDPNVPLYEWRYFMCPSCGIVYESHRAASACCEGLLLPMLVTPVEEVGLSA